jgi:hypothetical protein
MIITEFYTTRPDGVNLYRTYSDNGFFIEQNTGAVYSEAIDVENSGFTYTETDTLIPDEPTTLEQMQEALGILGATVT